MAGLSHVTAPRLDLLVLLATVLVLVLSAATNQLWIAAVSVLLAGLVAVRELVTVRQVGEIDRARRKSEARFGWLVMNSSDLIMAVDASGVIDDVSPSVERLPRTAGGQLLGMRLTDPARWPSLRSAHPSAGRIEPWRPAAPRRGGPGPARCGRRGRGRRPGPRPL